ncbi:autotransporter outer membrane beta-barrel domain-containing protein [Aeromonas bivalvium]|uniref:Autotransporter outer membrane beta-barrel domain-containing protein n=1 Tax=Aeromonas bivalvium TaxID=440079 RepID=A0ABW9GMI9_9GAMM|nr:autotransporter outer membrane beta-barrel domain-containing protein [Aeromonas bivalvium]
MKKITLSIMALAACSSASVMAQDAFSYAKGAAIWTHTQSDFIGGKDSDNRDFGGLSLDLSKSFGSNVYGRLGSEYSSRNSGNDSMAISNLGVGVFTPLSTGLNLYGETGLMGYSLERELSHDVDGWDSVARKKSGSLYGEVGLRYDLGQVELSTAYRYANMTDDMQDFKVGGAYKLTQNLALTADYTYRRWDLQQGSITSLGVKYNF